MAQWYFNNPNINPLPFVQFNQLYWRWESLTTVHIKAAKQICFCTAVWDIPANHGTGGTQRLYAAGI